MVFGDGVLAEVVSSRVCFFLGFGSRGGDIRHRKARSGRLHCAEELEIDNYAY